MPPSDPRPEALDVVAVILAAGRSTRMRSSLPKPLHELCGRPLTGHVIHACRSAGISRVIVVVGYEADRVRELLGADVEYAHQAEQLGSGHAVRCAADLIGAHSGAVMVLAGDVPLLLPDTLTMLARTHARTGAAATLLTSYLEDPTGYGRVVRNEDGSVCRVVEQRDASEQELQIKEWNPSIYCFDSRRLLDTLPRIRPNNAQGEYYLTDVIGILASAGERVSAAPIADPTEVLGVNSRADLASVAAALRARILSDLMLSGVTVIDPSATYVDVGVSVGPDTVLEPGTFLRGATRIGSRCAIGPNTEISNSSIGDDCLVVWSRLSGALVGAGVRVGPYAHLRPGTVLRDGARVGDFVEVKNSTLAEGASALHLSYLGDADVGPGANIGAGTITCNFDGRSKHRTSIGRQAFIGSHTTLVAPVAVGDGAVTGAGSTITEDVPADALAVARSRQEARPGWARRRREKWTRSEQNV